MEAPCPTPDLGMCIPLAVPTPRICSKDTALRQKGGYMLNPVKVSMQTHKIWQAGVGVYVSCSHWRPASYVRSLAYETCHLPMWSGLPLSSVSLCPLHKGSNFRLHVESSRGGCEPNILLLMMEYCQKS